MSLTSTLISSGRSAALLAVVLLQFVSLRAQAPPGYTPNRNINDPGPANPPPLTPEQRQAAGPFNQALAAQALGDMTVPPEFEVKVFATPPVFNSPTAVAGAPDGSVYVAGDGNGAQAFFPKMGHVVRLRDTNGDGQADQATQFVPDIDSVRGLVWHNDHLIVMAPPNISAFYDRNNDGVADEQKILIRGVGRILAEARVDHGQNNLKAGMDGWIYLGLGDQGIHDATGSDGRKLQHRGGGVMRFRPDGSQMEMWAIGTRNNYGVAVGPVLDSFARDNTNDGGGWNVRFHHFSGMTDHGYPTRFINFGDEIVQPLADFGGGSGIGALWIDEPGYPAKWNNAPFTADYGRTGLYHHEVIPNGATYKLPANPDGTANITGTGNELFVTVPNPMDMDLDLNSNLYFTTWRGGGFAWSATANTRGMLYKIRPRNFTPAPVPNYNQLNAAALVVELQSPSFRRRIEAQRAILRRQLGTDAAPLLAAVAADRTKRIEQRAAAIYTLRLARGTASFAELGRLVADPSIAAVALRALGDDTAQARQTPFPLEIVEGALKSSDPVVRKEATIALARANAQRSAPAIAALMDDKDPIIFHTAVQALRSLKAVDASLAIIDSTTASAERRKGALQVLQFIHEPRVVSALSSRLGKETNASRRLGLVAALSRLANQEAPWNGTWWGTRPQTVGPYFDARAWAETPAVTAALDAALNKAAATEIVALGREIQRNGASAGAAVSRFIAFADKEPALVPQITAYFADAETIPAPAIPVLLRAMTNPATTPVVRAQAISALARTNSAESWAAMPTALQSLQGAAGGGRGGGGRGAGAASVGPPGAALNPVQTSLVAAMDAGVAERLRAVVAARSALFAESLVAQPNPATLAQRVDALSKAELSLATARADYYARIQNSVARLSAQQASALAAQQAAAMPGAGGGGGGGGGGRGGGVDFAARGRTAVLNSPRLDDHYRVFIQQAERMAGDVSTTADGILLNLSARKFGSEPPRQAAATSIDQGWKDPRRRLQIITAAVVVRDTSRALQIADAVNDADFAVAQTAKNAVQMLAIDADQLRAEAKAPRLASMPANAVLDAVMKAKGTIARGQQLVTEVGCTACHTVSATEAPKGPYLGGIAGIMTRRQIAEAILQPNASISQGFATYQINLRDGTAVVGFIVREAPDALTVRNIAGHESRVAVANIANRTQLPTSLMPEGLTSGITLNEFASLIDYLESLSK